MTQPIPRNEIFIRKLTDIILANLDNENFGVRELADASGMSRYSLALRLQAMNGKTIIQFLREVRLEKARELLQNESFTVAEVAYKTGFGSPAYFNKCYHDHYGYPPGKAARGEILIQQPENQPSFPESFQNKSWFKTHVLSIRGILLLFLFAATPGYFLLRNILSNTSSANETSSNKNISIVVWPFQNMTRDTIWDIWQFGIQESLISSFANTSDLKVRQRETVNTLLRSKGIPEFAAISQGVAGEISNKLEADIYIYGSIMKSGFSVRLDAQAIDAKSTEVLKSFEVTGPYEEAKINEVIDSLRRKVTDFLIVTKLLREDPFLPWSLSTPSTSPEAFRYYVYGYKAESTGDFTSARKWYLKSLEIDSTLWAAAISIFIDYGYEGNAEQNLTWILNLNKKSDRMPILEQLWINWAYACNFEAPEVAIKYLKQLQEIDESPGSSYLLGYTYMTMNEYDKAIPEYERSVNLCRKWGIKPDEILSYYGLLYGYFKGGQMKKHKNLMKEMTDYMPNEPNIIFWQSIVALTEDDTATSNGYVKTLTDIRKEHSVSDADIAFELSDNYSDLGFQDKAEDNFRKALSLDPENPKTMLYFARFLNVNNRHLDEVPELMDNAMNLAPGKIEYYNCLDAKGWSLYKQGKKQEALEILERTWDEAPFKLYSIKEHLDEVKEAVAHPV